MGNFLKKYLYISLLGLSSCHVPSRVSLDGTGGRTAYNMSLQKTNSQQMLLNLVRLRYFDIPYFLDVGGVTTQFTYRSGLNASIKIPGFTSDNPASVGGDVSWQNQPTVQYSPLEGHAFASQLLQPIDLKILQRLIYSGWDIERIFRLAIQGFGDLVNAPEASGPTPALTPKGKDFYIATQLMKKLQETGNLKVGVRKFDKKDKNCPQQQYALQIVFPTENEISRELAKIVPQVKAQRDHYILQLNLGFDLYGKIGILSRSILSCMYYLSQSVEVPYEDLIKGCVEQTLTKNGDPFDWHSVLEPLMTIYSSKNNPKDAYVKVKYRGHWFYISDIDLTSKKTFVLLQQLYTLQAGEASRTPPPILTIPIG